MSKIPKRQGEIIWDEAPKSSEDLSNYFEASLTRFYEMGRRAERLNIAIWLKKQICSDGGCEDCGHLASISDAIAEGIDDNEV